MAAASAGNLDNSPPQLRISLPDDAAGSLEALWYLSQLKESKSHHEELNKRHPLAIYNTSISRVCMKVNKCCDKIEKYMLMSRTLADLSNHNLIRQELVDYLELSLYSAAEHVDDIESIARCFFSNTKNFSKSKQARMFKNNIKPIRDRLSSFANHLKHNQGRIRIFSAEFGNTNDTICLHGFFIESFNKGAIGPCPILHKPDEQVISVTSFLWDIMIFIFEMSGALGHFLKSVNVIEELEMKPVSCVPYCKAITALVRLPIYSFDDMHPFSRVRVTIVADEATITTAKSGIHGSLLNQWNVGVNDGLKRYLSEYEGDGVTRSFKEVRPQALNLKSWH